LLTQQKFPCAFFPSFFDGAQQGFSASTQEKLELFAMDLLHAELRFKACEREFNATIEFDGDANFVSCIVPLLVRRITGLDDECKETEWERAWLALKTRANWLTGCYFLWRSRIAQSVYESVDAEQEGLEYIDKTMECLCHPSDNPLKDLITPHLESPRRSGSHWRKLCQESLSSYRDEIKASSVVSHSQQQFQERLTLVMNRARYEDKLPRLLEDDVSFLSGICKTLLERYYAPFEQEGNNHRELLDNLISIHGDELFIHYVGLSSSDEKENGTGNKLESIIPIGIFDAAQLASMSNPSILTILVACLQVSPGTGMQVALILTRLVLAALDRYHQMCQSGTNERGAQMEAIDGFSDSEDVDSTEVDEPGKSDKSPHSDDALNMCRLLKYLLDKVRQAVDILPDDEMKGQIAACSEVHQMIHHCLAFCARWASDFVHQPAALERMIDREVFMSVRNLAHSLFDASDDTSSVSLKELYFGGLARIIVCAQASFASLVRVQGAIRVRRAVRQRICFQRVDFISTLFCETSHLLSRSLVIVRARSISRSTLADSQVFKAINGASIKVDAPSHVFVLCETLLWFCAYARDDESDAASSFDRPIIERLKVPLAAVVVSLCGASSCTRLAPTNRKSRDGKESNENQAPDELCLSQFLDSDDSANDLSEDDEKGSSSQGSRKEVLRVLCHLVHCVALVFGSISEKEIVTYDSCELYTTKHGPLLPLVVTRVLNHVADKLLEEFTDAQSESSAQGRWSNKYPFATGGLGALLDSALYKAYRCLHGFTLVCGNEQYPTKDHVKTSSTEMEIPKYAPEDHSAAARLYRCILRTGKKKAPPRAAFETVSYALPPLEETEKSKMMRSFLFSGASERFGLNDVVAIVTQAPEWQNLFVGTRSWLCTNESQSRDGDNQVASDDETVIVRKGLLAQLAMGDLPAFSNEVGGKEDDRAGARRYEEELSKKFFTIFNTLCFDDPNNVRGWFRAAECLTLKSNFIADRLGLSLGFARNANFAIPEQRPPPVTRISAAALEEKQERELVQTESGWIPFLGNDLSLYMKHHWSAFDSLRSLSAQLLTGKGQAGSRGGVAALYEQAEQHLQEMQEKGRHLQWQQSWGGMFITALERMAVRCMCLAVFIFFEQHSTMSAEDKKLMPEVFESLGITFYSNLMGSQGYGYPMHVLPKKRKRQLAETAKTCFETSVNIARKEHAADTEVWDLMFMVGKVCGIGCCTVALLHLRVTCACLVVPTVPRKSCWNVQAGKVPEL
jgi:hypothetical protein